MRVLVRVFWRHLAANDSNRSSHIDNVGARPDRLEKCG
jgi:hypothetical protein